MKKIYSLLLVMAVALSVAFTSCDDSYGPPGSGGYIDRNLVGTWQLISVNGRPVSGTQSNYFDFYNNGTGTYYFYRNGVPYQSAITYWCEADYNADYLCIQYPDTYSEVAYWFNGNASRLYMRWYEGGWQQEYVYAYVSDFYWQTPARRNASAGGQDDAVTTADDTPRPGENFTPRHK